MVRLPSTKAENLKYLLTIMPDDVWGKYLAQYLYVCVCMPACLPVYATCVQVAMEGIRYPGCKVCELLMLVVGTKQLFFERATCALNY